MVALVWEVLSGVAMLLGGFLIAAGVWGSPPIFRWRGIGVIECIVGVICMMFGVHCLDLARQGLVAQRGGIITRYR